MQRVVRHSLLGILTAAALVGCGDKVTIPVTPTAGPDLVVHSVTVSPAAVSLAIGGKVTLAASVDAGAGVTNRGVTWSSSNTAVATVGTDGTVTGVAAGSVTVIASSAADANVKGASAVTVTGGGATTPPTVTISAINQNPTGQPANLNNAFGQLDVVLNVDSNGQILKTVSATMACPGSTTLTQSQTISGASSVAAEAAVAPITLSFNTALFDATTGAPKLRNGACTLTASATTGTSTTQSASTNLGLNLNNLDGVVLSEQFASYTNAEGKPTVTTATDGLGLPWKGGAVTVTALPVLYSGRAIAGGTTPGNVSITLPNVPAANNPTVTVTPTAAGPVTATWSATSTAAATPRVTALTLVGAGFEANGVTPLGITPAVTALDNAGNDLPLLVLNFSQPALNLPNPTFRLDNAAPQPPTFFSTPAGQANWVNAAYVFTGQGANFGFAANTGFANYVSCGDGANLVAAGAGACVAAQVGVSAKAVSGNSGKNGLTTFTYYAIPFASYPGAPSATQGTSTSATSCSTTGWTQINTGGDLAEANATGSPFYVVRVFETDKLGNARCTDLAKNTNVAVNINNGAFAVGKFSVDKTPPTAVYAEAATDPSAASNNGALGAAGNIANFNIKIGLSDNASGFSGTPVTSQITRLAMNGTTPSNSAGNFNNAFACPSGIAQSACQLTTTPATVPGNAAGITDVNGVVYATTVDGSGCLGCGYFTFSQSPTDLAGNQAATITGTAAPTISGASATGAGAGVTFSGFRQVVIDQQAPIAGGIAVPASIAGGTSAAFATNATDNLDLVSSDYTLTYAANPAGNVAPGANLPIRAPGVALGTAFDNVLTTCAGATCPSGTPFNITVPFFVRSIATTSATNGPQNNGGAGLPASIAMRAYDAANNVSLVNAGTNTGFSNIGAANVPQTGRTDFTIAPAGNNAGATMVHFLVPTNNGATVNPATGATYAVQFPPVLVSNCLPAGCNGGLAPVNATSTSLVALAVGNEGANFQFLNPFAQVQFYYFDTVTNEYVLAGTAVAPVVSDNNAVTFRTFTWTLPSFDPPATLGSGATLKVIAVGVNAQGDGLASGVNTGITLTNP